VQDINKQVAVRARDRIRIVKMAAVKLDAAPVETENKT
jgi:hypothetical protein